MKNVLSEFMYFPLKNRRENKISLFVVQFIKSSGRFSESQFQKIICTLLLFLFIRNKNQSNVYGIHYTHIKDIYYNQLN